MARAIWLVALLVMPSAHPGARADERGPIGHWRLAGDAKDGSGQGNHGQVIGADMTAPGPDGRPAGAARFDGKGAFIRVPASPSLALGTGDFTLAVWAHTEEKLDDVLGDLVSKYDPAARRGLNWCIKNGAGATTSQANYRNVHFGIDAGTEPAWTDRGRPGDAVYVMAMAVHDGALFAGTCEAGEGETGHVYRYDGGTRWVDCGAPDRMQRRDLARGPRRQALRRDGPISPGGLLAAGIDEREPRGTGLPLRRRRGRGRNAAGCRRSRPWGGWSSTAATSTPRRSTSRPASSATGGAASGRHAPSRPTAAGSSHSRSTTATSMPPPTTGAPSPDSTARAGSRSVRSNRPGRPTPSRSPPANSSSGPGPTGRSSATTGARSGSRPGAWARRRRSWAWRSTTASSTPAPCRWPRCTATMAARPGPAPAGST